MLLSASKFKEREPLPISSTERKAGPFYGNGSAATFTFEFKLFEASELRVVHYDVDVRVGRDLVAGIDYNITLNPDQDDAPGGVVTLAKPLANGDRLALLSNVADLQPVDLTNQGGFYPDLVNGGLDRATIQVQQIREQLGRAITLPPTAEDGTYELPLPEGNQLLVWGPDGKSIVNIDPRTLVSVVTYGNTRADKFDGDGTNTVFALSGSPGSVNNLAVSIDGVVQVPEEDFVWSGNNILSFSSPPPAGSRVLARYQEALDEGTDVSGKADKSGGNLNPSEVVSFRDALAALSTYNNLSDLADADASLANLGGAKDDLSNVLASVFASKTFTVPGRSAGASLAQRFSRKISLKDDCGAVGDNIADDTAAVADAINRANASATPVMIDCGGGIFKITGPLPEITSPTMFEGGAGKRVSVFTYAGSNDLFKFHGNDVAGRVADAGFRGVIINTVGSLGGFAVSVDFCQSFSLVDTIITNPYNGVRIRQSGDINFTRSRIDKARGDYGLYAFGTGATRYGQIDKIDVLDLDACTFEGIYVPGDAAKKTRLLDVDGWVHTINLFSVRLLSALSGLRTLNSFGLDAKYTPAFIRGRLEVENTWEAGVDLQWATDVALDLFAASSVSESGVVVGEHCRGVRLYNLHASNNWKFGAYVAPGARDVWFTAPFVASCNKAGAGLAGIEDGSGALTIIGGVVGDPPGEETQEYGVRGVAGTRVIGVDARGNLTAPFSGDFQKTDCLPVDLSVITLLDGATAGVSSPYEVPTSQNRRIMNIAGGAVDLVRQINGGAGAEVIFHTSTNVEVTIRPGERFDIWYSSQPIVRVRDW